MKRVSVGVIEVTGSSVRLLVAEASARTLVRLREERALLGPEDGREHARIVNAHARVAREFGIGFLEVVLADAARLHVGQLVPALRAASGAPVRLLAPEEEAELVWAGAIAPAGALPETVAVCDVRARSTIVVVGTLWGGPVWMRTLDIGAADLAGRPAMEARGALASHFEGFLAPLPKAALATPVEGATAAGALLILAEARRRLGVPFRVAEGGLREGAALALVRGLAAA
ncbi:MAG: hypothetical protein M3312_00855 [Actinomycetota bacterium]|nr:hypothetical protein [Actinomycetota bacterium]